MFVDGAFRSRAIFGATDLFDVERIEILRGPQSTLYGKNTTAGVIGIYTAPPTDSFSARGEATLGSIEGGAGDAQLDTGQSCPVRTAGRSLRRQPGRILQR